MHLFHGKQSRGHCWCPISVAVIDLDSLSRNNEVPHRMVLPNG